MAVTIVKTNKVASKVNAAKVVEVIKSEAEIRAEKVVEMYPSVELAKKAVAAYEVDRKFLAAWADENGDPEDTVSITTDNGSIIKFSPKASQTKVADIKAIKEMLGDDVFFELVTIPVESLKKYLSAKELEKVTVSALSGARRISVSIN
jgi:hypothetical protein